MKVKKVPCRSIRYKEFPDLLFGTPQEGAPAYFDATHFIQSRGDEKRHSLADFRVAFHLWIEELCRQYEIDREDLFIRDEASGHLLMMNVWLYYLSFTSSLLSASTFWSEFPKCLSMDLRFQTPGWFNRSGLDLRMRN